MNTDEAIYKNLAIPPWDLIIDFDTQSKIDGFFRAAYSENDIASHEMRVADVATPSSFSPYSPSPYHLYVNNYVGSGKLITKEYTEWRNNFDKNIDVFIGSFAQVFQAQKTIVVILYPHRRYVSSLCEKLERNFGSTVSFVVANDPKDALEVLEDDFRATRISISTSDIAREIVNFSSNFNGAFKAEGQYILPYLKDSETKEVTGILTAEEFAKLEEDFEVLHAGLPIPQEEQDRRDFLTGREKISWFGLKSRFDVELQTFRSKYIKPIERQIENGKGKIFLQHEAGFGGTTLARRIAWELRNDFPTLILKKYRVNKIKEQLTLLHEKTRKTLLIIMEVPQAITMDEVDFLYRSIQATRPVVFLIVKRGKAKEKELSVTDWGNNVSDLIREYKPFIQDYEPRIRERKLGILNKIPFSNNAYEKTPFYIGLVTFEEEFFAIKDYVKNFVLEVQDKPLQKKILSYLSLADDYLGQGLPVVFFRGILKAGSKGKDILNLPDYFNQDSSIVSALLTTSKEGKQQFWKIRHPFLAREIKLQILSGNSDNPELWKKGLAGICIDFIKDSKCDGITSEYVEELLKLLFIGNRKDRAGLDFTSIINDIPTINEKEAVFVQLTESYQFNPHYFSHLARFYAYNNKNWTKAIEYADKAIELAKIEEDMDDPLLHHIKGMCLRSIAYDTMEEQERYFRINNEVDELEFEKVIYDLVPKAEQEFRISREISQYQQRIDAHGYVSHIQLLIRAIDYGAIVLGKSRLQLISENKDPFMDWLDLAESLLEDVRRLNFEKDESPIIDECDNSIEGIYENYEQILQNLRSQLDSGKNPSRTRRQIVRVYMRRKSDYYRDSKVVDSIMELMEENIGNEPENQRNFFLWFQVARYSTISIESAMSKLEKWRAISTAIDPIFYLGILNVFKAIEGYSDAALEAYKLFRDCRAKGKGNITAYEWYGKGIGMKRLVNKKELTDDNRHSRLELVRGFFTDYEHEGNGKITIADRLEVFFSPTQAKLTSNDKNKAVEFYLGFSYDGLRADSKSVRLVSGSAESRIHLDDDFDASELKIELTPENSNSGFQGETNATPSYKIKRIEGTIVDLQRPPHYVMGLVEDYFGKRYFFHKSNEKADVFRRLKLNSVVTFELKDTEKGNMAHNLKFVEE